MSPPLRTVLLLGTNSLPNNPTFQIQFFTEATAKPWDPYLFSVSAEVDNESLVNTSLCQSPSSESIIPPVSLKQSLNPAIKSPADNALFDFHFAFVRTVMEVQTARHLIVSQHIHFHGKYAVNVFFFNSDSSQCFYWQIAANVHLLR